MVTVYPNSLPPSPRLISLVDQQVRFRQILKKHGLMAQAPETPRSQAQKRKAVVKSEESLDDDEDGDSSYNPSSGAAKPSVRKRSAPRATGSRTKRMKASLKSEHDQADEEAVSNGVGVAPAPAPKYDTETGIKAEAKTESEPGSDNGMAPLNDDGVAGAIDGTASASPHEQSHGQAPSPQVFSTGVAPLLDLGHRQSALSANMDDPRMTQLQFRHPGMVPNATSGNSSFSFGQQLNPSQLAALQPQQLAAEQLQAYQLNRFQAAQMFPYQMSGLPGGNLPFGYMAQMQLNEHFPVGAYNGVSLFDQAQPGHDVSYGYDDDDSFRGRVDGQDEWDLDSGNVKREVTPEAKQEAETECEREGGDEVKYDDKP